MAALLKPARRLKTSSKRYWAAFCYAGRCVLLSLPSFLLRMSFQQRSLQDGGDYGSQHWSSPCGTRRNARRGADQRIATCARLKTGDYQNGLSPAYAGHSPHNNSSVTARTSLQDPSWTGPGFFLGHHKGGYYWDKTSTDTWSYTMNIHARFRLLDDWRFELAGWGYNYSPSIL
jgi:hypothetical protein